MWEWIDGININSGAYYVCNNQATFADDITTGYTSLNYAGATNWSESYIKEIGIDTNSTAYMLPAVGGGSSSTYYCDGVWSATGWRVAKRGGSYGSGTGGGLFALDASVASSYTAGSIGSRLLYIHREVSFYESKG